MKMTYKIADQPKVEKEVASIEEAVKSFTMHRDGMDEQGNFTGLDFGSRELLSRVEVRDGQTLVAHINYNGTIQQP